MEPPRVTREEFEERRAAQREAEKKAQREAKERREKELARADWLALGGDPDGFETEWPEIQNAMLTGEVIARRDAAREESRRRFRATF